MGIRYLLFNVEGPELYVSIVFISVFPLVLITRHQGILITASYESCFRMLEPFICT